MSDDVLITPASRKIEFFDSSNNIDAKIELDVSGNLLITNQGGNISLGDTATDIFIGDGTTSVDIVFEQNGSIRGTGSKTITLGESGDSIVFSVGANVTFNEGFSVHGTVTATDFNSTSDIRFKRDIEKIEGALDKISLINGYTFTMNETEKRSTGVIAQEVEKILPEAVGGSEDHRTVAYGNMIGLLIEAIKEQNELIQKQNERIQALESILINKTR